MVFQFKLPDIAEGVHEGEIVAWHVKPGQAVKEDQDMVEVMTDKATVMIKSPRTGAIQELLAKEGQVVKVGDVIVTIAPEGSAATSSEAAPAPAAKEPEAEEEKTLFDLPTDFSGGSRLKKQQPKPVDATPAGAAKGVSARGEAGPQVGLANGQKLRDQTLAAPAVRWKAREMGVDLDTVPASGANGRITTADWQSFLTSGGATRGPSTAGAPQMAAPQIAVGAEDEQIPLKGLRKAIFENMQRSEAFAVPFTYWDEFDVTDLVKLRKEAAALAKQQGVGLTYLPFIVKAVVSGLKQHPHINAWVDENSRTLVRKNEFHIGVAVATDRGLMVVVVRDADKKSIFEIARDIETMSQKARDFKASPEELKGSTFTITSLGKEGGLGATPVINHPEVAILGVHKIEARAKVDEDRQVVVRDCMNLSGSFDHRWIDGHIAAAFLQHVGKLLAQPHLLLLGTA